MSIPEQADLDIKPDTIKPDTPAVAARRAIDLGRLAARAYGRPDLEAVIVTALARIDRPQTMVAVIGEFKKGKSSLINALLGVDIAPVDDDLSTAVTTLYRHGEEAAAIVLSVEEGQDVQRIVPVEEALSLSREQDNPENARGIRAIEVQLPNDLLKTGLILVDTPGFGGLAVSGASVSQVLLRAVDAVIMVSDASTPLLRSEVDLLTHAAAVCPAILLALSKTDLYPAWRDIAAGDEAAIAAAGLDVPVLPVSSVLMAHARLRGDSDVAGESGVPALSELLQGFVLDTSRAEACRRGLGEARSAISQIEESALQALAALEDPDRATARLAELEAAKDRLEHLRGPGSRWSQVLSDVLSDTTGEADHSFRFALRTLSREVDDDIEKIDPGRAWDALAEKIRSRAGSAVDTLFAQVEDGAREAERAVLEWLRSSEGLDLAVGRPGMVTALTGWAPRALDVPGYAQYAGTLWSGLRGAQGGMLTIGMMASLASITLATGALAGVGLVFGGKQILDERNRQLQARRQQARTNAKQFIDDLQFETNKRVRDLSRDLQRQLRDGFLELVATRQRTCTDSLAAVQAAVQQDASARASQITSLRERLDQLKAIDTRAAEAEAAL